MLSTWCYRITFCAVGEPRSHETRTGLGERGAPLHEARAGPGGNFETEHEGGKANRKGPV